MQSAHALHFRFTGKSAHGLSNALPFSPLERELSAILVLFRLDGSWSVRRIQPFRDTFQASDHGIQHRVIFGVSRNINRNAVSPADLFQYIGHIGQFLLLLMFE